MISKKLLKSSLLYTIVGSLPLASGLILLPFYTNYLKGVDTFGVLTLYVNFSLLVQLIVNFSIDTSIGIHYFDYKDDIPKFKKYVGTLISSLLIIGGSFLLISMLFGDFVFDLIFDKKTLVFLPFGLIAILTAFFNSIYKTYSNLLINQQRATRFFWINIIYFVTTILFTLIGLYLFPFIIDGPLWGRLLSGALLFGLCLYFFIKEFGISFHKEFINETFRFCRPLVYYSFIIWVTTYGDRYIINYLLKPFDVGVYDFGMKCTLLIEVVLLALTNTINPSIFRIWTDEKLKESTPEVNQHHHIFTLVMMFLIALTLLFIPLLAPFFIHNKDYFLSFKYLPILVVGFMFRGMFNMYLMPLFYFKKTKVLPKVFLISSIFQFVISYYFIQCWGLTGAAISFVATKPLQIWLLSLESKKEFSFNFNRIKIIYLPSFYALFIIVSYYYGIQIISRSYIDVIQFVICCFMIGIAYKNEIKKMPFFKKR